MISYQIRASENFKKEGGGSGPYWTPPPLGTLMYFFISFDVRSPKYKFTKIPQFNIDKECNPGIKRYALQTLMLKLCQIY